jgi:hypothetical protein
VEGPQPLVDEIPLSGSLTVQLRVTLSLFQPLAFGAGATEAVISGAVRSDSVMTATAFAKYFAT